MTILGYDVRIYFLLFIIYAVAGWIMEVTCKLIQYKRFINRGFLIGPYCPIYGYGALLITFLLGRYKYDALVLFVMAIVVCGTLEYLTSLVMEKMFKARWWDYSQRKFNLNGRVCLGTIIPFGILGLMVTYVTNPFLLGKLELIPEMWLNIVSGILFAIYVVDNIVSGVVIKAIKKADITASKETDNTEEITKKVREILQSKSALHRRLVDAFPKLQAVKIKIKDQTEKIKKEAIRQKEEIETKVEDTTKAIAEKVSNVSITGKKKKQIKEENGKDNKGAE